MELHVFLSGTTVPGMSAWQAAINRMRLPIELDVSLDLGVDTRFVRANVDDVPSGFELYADMVAELAEQYPRLPSELAVRDSALSFRWGGDLRECACACAVAAALIEGFGAAVYDPEADAVHLRADELAAIAGDCLRVAREKSGK